MILSPNIDENDLTGSIQTEIGSLTELTEINLSKELFSILLLCLKTKQIRSMLLTLASGFVSKIFDRQQYYGRFNSNGIWFVE